jgi:hypothetical protein
VWNKEAIQRAQKDIFHGTRRHNSNAEWARQETRMSIFHKRHKSCEGAFLQDPFWCCMMQLSHPALAKSNW